MNPNKELYLKRLGPIPGKTKFYTRIIRYFPNTSLRNGHDGLASIADKHGIDLSKLVWGEYVIFTNTAKNALKMFTCGQLIAHLRLPKHMSLDPRTISLIPRFFNGSQINYDAAIAEVINRDFNK